jgi:type II secretory ATPase GspE/PulE/Tfp pilus assembly ATPase PilB-like protein
MDDLFLANTIHHMSHMMVVREGTRPEPRLRRLLGHIATYDNAEQWRKDNQQKIFHEESAAYHQAQVVHVTKPLCHATIVTDKELKLRTLVHIQAAVRGQLQQQKETTVMTEEVLSSDSESETEEAEEDEDEESESEEEEEEEEEEEDSDDESTWSDDTWDDEDPIHELIRTRTREIMQHDAKDNVVFYREAAELVMKMGEQDRAWPL